MARKTLTESEKARQWRESFGLSRPQLAAMIPYSVESIIGFELGVVRRTGEPIAAEAFARYKLVCAAIDAGVKFDWNIRALKAAKPAPKKKQAR